MEKFLEQFFKFLENFFATQEQPRDSLPPEAPAILPEPIQDYSIALPKIVKLNISWQKKKFITPSKMPIGLIVHYTVSGRSEDSARGVTSYFANTPKTLGYQLACPIMSESGILYVSKDWDILKDCNNNAGPSSWKGMSNLSQRFMGVEICSWGLLDSSSLSKVPESQRRVSTKRDNIKPGTYQAYTEAQELALINLCYYLKKNCPGFSFDNVVGHDEIAPTRKSDPGASLSMTMPKFRQYLKDNYNP